MNKILNSRLDQGLQFFAILTLSILMNRGALADEFSPPDMKACSPDIVTYCPGIRSGGGRIVQCLQSVPSISTECKSAVSPSDGVEGKLSITVTITGIKSKSGYVFVTPSDSPDSFRSGKRMIIVPASANEVTATFRYLKAGVYAVTAFHDENDNGKFDFGLTGAEGFAASNGAKMPPSFGASSVKVSSDTKFSIAMTYY